MRVHIPLVILVGLALPLPVSAWHKDGHMAIARIAWQKLSDKEQAQVTKILQAHVHDDIDHYKIFLLADRPSNLDPEISPIAWAFARAAAWPDWVRNPRGETHTLDFTQSNAIKKAFHRGPWHFINLPFVRPGDDQFDVAALRQKALEPEFKTVNCKDEPQHAVAALKQSIKVLQSADALDADKAVALCWLLHLVGDLHQPLHASAFFAKAESLPKTDFDPPPAFEPPAGDAGGNRLAVKLRATNKNAQVFHAYWDALVFKDNADFKSVEDKINALLKDPKYQPDQLTELAKMEFLDWAEESLELAKTVAYREKGTADSDFLNATPLPSGLSPEEQNKVLHGLDALVLSDEYQQAATATAERRIVLAGYRLAEQVKRALQPAE